jgi:hypothetical protein
MKLPLVMITKATYNFIFPLHTSTSFLLRCDRGASIGICRVRLCTEVSTLSYEHF